MEKFKAIQVKVELNILFLHIYTITMFSLYEHLGQVCPLV